MSTTTETSPPRVWVGCESCYAAGRLVGFWVNAVDAADVTAEAIHAESDVDWRVEGCEEFTCMDTDGLPTNGEPSLSEAARWGEIYQEVGAEQWLALCAWVRSGAYAAEGDSDFPVLSDFEERYAGEWESFRDFAFQFAEDTGLLQGVPEEVERYFHWDSWIRDLEVDYSVERAPGNGVYIFRNF
ncbi:antirestriction protein ArdA [Gordonia alkaliphila]|uniref:Antirestriction protein ArdA n=1 Tax=Gordonia alkaliphila TaxID=1053547 RepID=A0ABP8Z4G7_9ACTN